MQSLGIIHHLDGLFLDLFGNYGQCRVLRKPRENRRGLDKANQRLILLCKNRDATGKRHVKTPIDRQHLGRLCGITHLEHFALIFECQPFIAKCRSQIVDMQHTKTVPLDRDFKIDCCLCERFCCLNNIRSYAVDGRM